ncbi:MAG: hypothetical protein MUP22_05215 [Desulfobacterales bacterium]|nr:hypothetical protein [Desulfobacterales bacterium]
MPLLKHLERNQRLRVQRFSIAAATYLVVILVTFLTTQLGLGEMNAVQWALYIALGLIGNAFFLILFFTNLNLRFSEPSLTREQIIFSAFWGMVPLYSLPEARPIVLLFYVPAFSFGLLRLSQRQHLFVETSVLGLYALLLALEYYQGRPGFNIQYELFIFALFGILLTWFAFFGGFVHTIRESLRLQNKEIQNAHEEIKIEIEERKLTQIEKDKLIVELKDALNKVKTLSGLLPICASCKNIRDDKGYWNKIESYIRTHSQAEFTHSICPECSEKLYGHYKNTDKKN